MPFRLRKATREWFKNISGEFSLDFDMYYLCLIAGLATGRKEDAPASETTDLVTDFPGAYREKGRLITALFLSQELKGLGIKMSERQALHSTIRGLVDPLSSSHLSEAGLRELNRYSFGGFDVLTEWFGERPQAMETFLPLLKKNIDRALEEESANIG